MEIKYKNENKDQDKYKNKHNKIQKPIDRGTVRNNPTYSKKGKCTRCSEKNQEGILWTCGWETVCDNCMTVWLNFEPTTPYSIYKKQIAKKYKTQQQNKNTQSKKEINKTEWYIWWKRSDKDENTDKIKN